MSAAKPQPAPNPEVATPTDLARIRAKRDAMPSAYPDWSMTALRFAVGPGREK